MLEDGREGSIALRRFHEPVLDPWMEVAVRQEMLTHARRVAPICPDRARKRTIFCELGSQPGNQVFRGLYTCQTHEVANQAGQVRARSQLSK